MILVVQIFYHVLQDPLFHQVAFAVLTAVVVFRSIYIMKVNLRNSLRAIATPIGLPAEVAVKRETVAVREKDLLKQMWRMIGIIYQHFWESSSSGT